MTSIEDILAKMRRNPIGIRFTELSKVCDHYFGMPRKFGTSHRAYKTLWAGDPRVNIQNSRGKAKAYRVRQVVLAIDRLGTIDG